ncbi:MAG: SusC/RagA family TonB-linked outer membrane protein [Bacteroidales bacterium]|nr:SusC/RagA family TonB-linked outer membrane protein [Bacteroidales bacterium]
MFKKLQSALLMAILVTTTWMASAQNHTATGVVVDNIGPVYGAGVVVAGTSNGTITGADGSFVLNDVPTGSTLVVSCLGYETVEVMFNGQPVNVTLREDSELLNEVVVTALGLSREKKSLGYAVQDVKADALNRGGSANLTDALQGKIAGLQISNSGTGVGGSTRVVIRGSSSLSDNNEPLYVVDGVPYDTGGHDIDGQAGLWGGTDRSGGALDLNPEDIESISVLKGPTAAALYGSRAGNGVILITTKKGGKTDEAVGVTYTGKFSWSPVSYFVDMQNVYGQGSSGVYNAEATGSWGAVMSESTKVANWWDGTSQISYIGDANPYKEFYRTGNSQSHNVTIAGGGKDNPWRLSLGRDDNQSVIKPTTINKSSVDLVARLEANKWLHFDIKANYVKTVGNNRQTRGLYGTSFYITAMPRSIKMSDLEAHAVDENAAALGQVAHINWYGPNADYQNPYFIQRQFNNQDIQNKFFGMGKMTVDFSDNLHFTLKEGYNWVDYQTKNWYPYKDPVFTSAYPEVDMRKTTRIESNLEGLLSYNNSIGDFDFGVNVGGNVMHSKSEGLHGDGRKIAIVGAMFIEAGDEIKASNSLYEKEIQSVYGFANVGYKNFLFADFTARNDWTSTLPASNRSYFYPSVSLSYLLTGMMDEMGISYNKDILDFAKFRASWARVGKDTEPYQLATTYGSTTDAHGLITITQNTTQANANLKPEMADSFEIGTEWHFFKNRLGFDVTYYNTTTKNQVMKVDFPYSSGVQSKWINAGVINNQGFEFQINGDIIRTRDLTFGATLNLARNVNKVKELYHNTELGIDVDQYELGHMTGSAGVYVRAIEGEPIGSIYGTGYVRDDNGNIQIKDGLPVTESEVFLGSVQPDFTGSFGLNFAWKQISANALFSFKKGGRLFSLTEYAAAHAGTAARTGERTNFTFNGTAMDAQAFWTNAPAEEFMYDASFLKVGELSLGYNFSRKFLDNATAGIVKSAKLSIYGSNLFYLISHTPGTTPDGSSTDTSIFASAFDMCPYPTTRNFGASVTIGF